MNHKRGCFAPNCAVHQSYTNVVTEVRLTSAIHMADDTKPDMFSILHGARITHTCLIALTKCVLTSDTPVCESGYSQSLCPSLLLHTQPLLRSCALTLIDLGLHNLWMMPRFITIMMENVLHLEARTYPGWGVCGQCMLEYVAHNPAL